MVVKSMSLIELKKQQWAKEKELGKINGYWRNQKSSIIFDDQRSPERQYHDHRFDSNYDIHFDRNLSFPPILQDIQASSIQNNNLYIHNVDKDLPYDNHKGNSEDFNPQSTHTILNRTYTISKENNFSASTLERQKWQKGNPNTEFNVQNLNENERTYLNCDNNRFGTPAWVEYSSDKVSSTKGSFGPKIQADEYRKVSDFMGSSDTLSSLDSNNMYNRTYLLGQNIPLTSEEVTNREIKRQKALELQEAIKQQLKERQIKKKEEIERKKLEDLAEERRIKRQQEIEKQRLEEEIKHQREKELCDERKAKAMQEVLENAQKQAKEDKSKHLKKKRSTQEKLNEKLPEVVVTETVKNTEDESIVNIENKHQPAVELKNKEITSKLPEVDLQTSPTKIDRPKLLTPSKFRNQTTSIGTQTETGSKSMNTIYQKSIELDKRPKWGVNRPEVQYVKQSAKDLNYKSKLRQKSNWNTRTGSVSSSKSQPDMSTAHINFSENDPKFSANKFSALTRPNFAEMKNYKNVLIPTTSDSIAVSDVIYQLSSIRKVLETKRKHWKSVITDESPSSDSS
ncbi:myb-like protein X isoform X2 [Daktulosphaira vitifoliae]|uniref:myb-like protein X isoform X2 n=1 Tax=Daktulosphaira vitifoliae TaxID=58002 RepID=UPI0021AA962B|nr:myb-like protein X isoform X2 [Daktulosphaira vitifoliae]